jgi:hypothetical protein
MGREEVAGGAGGESFCRSVSRLHEPPASVVLVAAVGMVVGRKRWQERKVRVWRWPVVLLLPPRLHDEILSVAAVWLVDGEWV